MRRSTGFLIALLVGSAWTVQTAQAQDKAVVDHGIKVYAAQKCNVCHSIEGKGKKTGPLDGVGSKLSEAEIRDWIVNATEMTKKTKSTKKPVMKNYSKLSKEDVDGLVAYMMTLKKS